MHACDAAHSLLAGARAFTTRPRGAASAPTAPRRCAGRAPAGGARGTRGRRSRTRRGASSATSASARSRRSRRSACTAAGATAASGSARGAQRGPTRCPARARGLTARARCEGRRPEPASFHNHCSEPHTRRSLHRCSSCSGRFRSGRHTQAPTRDTGGRFLCHCNRVFDSLSAMGNHQRCAPFAPSHRRLAAQLRRTLCAQVVPEARQRPPRHVAAQGRRGPPRGDGPRSWR